MPTVNETESLISLRTPWSKSYYLHSFPNSAIIRDSYAWSDFLSLYVERVSPNKTQNSLILLNVRFVNSEIWKYWRESFLQLIWSKILILSNLKTRCTGWANFDGFIELDMRYEIMDGTFSMSFFETNSLVKNKIWNSLLLKKNITKNNLPFPEALFFAIV